LPNRHSTTERHRDLERVARDHLDRWDLRVDGPTRDGAATLVIPVLTAEGAAAVLKVSADDAGYDHEHLVLRRWGGDGAVLLLRADPPERTVLVERLHPRSLDSLSDADACRIVSGLYRRLHVPPMPQLRSVTSDVTQWTDALEQLPRSAPIPHRLVEQVAALSRELTTDRAGGSANDVVLHGNLHYGAVCSADRAPWLAVAPRPMNGDPHYELAPMLWHRWDDLAGNIRDGVRHRFSTLVDAAGLDEDLARAWTLIRVVHRWTRALVDGHAAQASALTRFAAIAKAVQD
jgi:streptomycin 6-kinase